MRFAFSQGGPNARIGGKTTAIAYYANRRLALYVKDAKSWARNITLEGSKKCKNHPFSWLRSQPLALLAVSTTTQSAQLLAPAQVLSRLNFWAQTLLAQLPSVPPLACSATTQAFADNINSRAIPARQKPMNRRWGRSLAAIFCLGDEN
jgi:hypothetical protein